MDCQASFAAAATGGPSQWSVSGAGVINDDGKLFRGGGQGAVTADGKTTNANADSPVLGAEGTLEGLTERGLIRKPMPQNLPPRKLLPRRPPPWLQRAIEAVQRLLLGKDR